MLPVAQMRTIFLVRKDEKRTRREQKEGVVGGFEVK